jgi:hypothetical protein
MASSESEEQTPESTKDEGEKKDEKEYELLSEDCATYDLSFKVIVIGNSGKKKKY